MDTNVVACAAFSALELSAGDSGLYGATTNETPVFVPRSRDYGTRIAFARGYGGQVIRNTNFKWFWLKRETSQVEAAPSPLWPYARARRGRRVH